MPTVLITGTSTGFGRVTTELLAARGWRVFATMRDLARKDSLEHALREAGLSERVTFVRLDVTDPASIETAVATVLSETDNTLDAVVHNAGIAVAGVLEDLSDGDIWRVMDTNFFGVLRLTRALLPRFREQRRGRIVLLSSQAAFAGQPGNSMYCASKWALEGWAESLAYEVDPFGIDVVLIEPGPYRTEIWSSTKWVVPANSAYLSWLKLLRQAADRHQARTSGDPKEVAAVIAKALEARRPRFRYQVGFFAKLDYFLRGKVPTRLIRRGTTRYLGLPLARW
ncbi:MAG TPA: SDR family oxidoreductase [Methyloceanibacter sp.]|jgi:NAD(P)-dependent dehydrogenase (short-subunit alcohol dehydrogenase family)